MKYQKFDSLLAEQYASAHLKFLNKCLALNSWNGKRVLKTDMFAEAYDPDRSFLWSILNPHTTGMDIDPEVVKQASTRCPCINCDVRKLPFKSSSFDIVISDSTLDHFRDKKDIMVSLREIARVLKTDGTLIITMDNEDNWSNFLYRVWIALGLNSFYVGHTYDMFELGSILNKLGLSIDSRAFLIHNPRFFVRRLVPLIRRIRSNKLDRIIWKILNLFNRIGNRYTAQFIAIGAHKCICM